MGAEWRVVQAWQKTSSGWVAQDLKNKFRG